ncbi:transposase family protein [Streptomyces sp. enrichment culture]|uniref:transposase family protein n=1 Tax=Streptomyces sp. enrichment culture TaxID=1795815 RepID=UPI003F5498DC
MPSCLEQLGNFSGSVAPETATDLRTYLNEVPCPRARRGIRHPWTALLTAAAAAVLVGAASMAVIGEWGADAPQRVLARLGFRPDPLTGLIRPPQPTTIRLGLAAVNDDALDRAIGRFLQERNSPPTSRRAVAVDGKTLWGSRTKDQPATALIAAMTHQGDVLAQMQVDGKRNEIQAFAPLLDGIDLTGAVITAEPCTPSTITLLTCTNTAPATWPLSRGTTPPCMSGSVDCPGARSAWTVLNAPGPITATRSAD